MSSFAASLFVGDIVDIDWSDGGGMNLLNIKTKTWDNTLLEVQLDHDIEDEVTSLLQAVGLDLSSKLGSPVSGNTVVGSVSEYMQER